MSPYFVDENVYLVTFFGKNGATPIEKNKRNYRKQDQHLKLARGQLELLKEMGEVEVGRPSKESLVREYLEDNPDHSPTEIARNLGISRTTVYKYIN